MTKRKNTNTPTAGNSKWRKSTKLIIPLATIGILIIAYLTYKITYENYKIKNRPFVEVTPISIINKGKEFNPNSDSKEKDTVFLLKSKVENNGQLPASIEEIYIWIENISENSKNLIIWNAKESYATKKFIFFQNKAKPFNPKIYIGKSDMDKIKNKTTVYFGFYIKYSTSDVTEDLQNEPFYYWAICRCNNFVPDKEGAKYRFLIEASGVTKIDPTSHNLNLKHKTGTQTVTTE